MKNVDITTDPADIKKIRGQVLWLMQTWPLGGQGERITRGQEFETSLGNVVKPRLY